ncbi:hypothetical protein [Streptomyces sp. cmx-4-25]|uniref:hypothetical protein n=1 Tax=Streptomyces sp. cmx-4-25 TaxID=2790933 RepID=UPI0039806697
MSGARGERGRTPEERTSAEDAVTPGGRETTEDGTPPGDHAEERGESGESAEAGEPEERGARGAEAGESGGSGSAGDVGESGDAGKPGESEGRGATAGDHGGRGAETEDQGEAGGGGETEDHGGTGGRKVAGGRGARARDERDDLSGQRMVNIEPGPGEGGGDEELALRRMLHGAVGGLEPSLGSLEHLRRAVPARRARKRQAVVGAAAAAVLIGTAVPAFVHVASSEGTTTASPVNVGHGEEAQGGTGTGTETGVEGGRSAEPTATSASPSPDGGEGAADGSSGKPEQPGDEASGAFLGNGLGVGFDRCSSGRLGSGGAQAGAPDAEGRVYGSFRVVNVSDTPCVVEGAGAVGLEARGAADPGRVSVVRHTSGDAGSGLPDPSQESARLLLKPNASYEVKFVWVPSETCPTTGSTPTPTPTAPVDPPTTTPPTPTPTESTGDPDPSTGPGSGGTGGTGGSPDPGPAADGGPAAQLLLADGEPADGDVVVSHTAEPGGPSMSAVVPDACAGTVYRTGLLIPS